MSKKRSFNHPFVLSAAVFAAFLVFCGPVHAQAGSPFEIVNVDISKPTLSAGGYLESERDFLVTFNREALHVRLIVTKQATGEVVTDYLHPDDAGGTTYALFAKGLQPGTLYTYGITAADGLNPSVTVSSGSQFMTDGAPPSASTAYVPSAASAESPDINADKRLVQNSNGLCASGARIKGSLPAVYYCGADGKRYVFVNDRVYASWYSDFGGVVILTDGDLAKIPLGGNVTYRPGVRMIKITSDPHVYAVERGGVLRLIPDETTALRLYGAAWNKMIDDVPDGFWVNYAIGTPISD